MIVKEIDEIVTGKDNYITYGLFNVSILRGLNAP